MDLAIVISRSKKSQSFLLVLIFFVISNNTNAQEDNKKEEIKIDYRIDNMGYWMHLVELGLVPVEPFSIPQKQFTKAPELMLTM